MLRVSLWNLLVFNAFKVVPLEVAMSSFLVCLFWVVLLQCTTSSNIPLRSKVQSRGNLVINNLIFFNLINFNYPDLNIQIGGKPTIIIRIYIYKKKKYIYIYTVVIRLLGALGYKTHPKLSNLIKLSSQTENYAKILGYKTHPKIESYQKDVMNLRTIILTQLACELFLLT